MSNTPYFSIVIPVYNGASFITETLDSLRRQSFTDFEVLIIDDGSTDNTVSLCKSYIQDDKRFQLIAGPRGGKPSIVRNIGIEQAKADYVCFLDADDLLTANTLELRQRFFTDHPEVGFLCSDYKDFRDVDQKNDVDDVSYLEKNDDFYQDLLQNCAISSGDDYDIFSSAAREKLMTKVFIHTSTVTIKKNLPEHHFHFDETLVYGEDWGLWLHTLETTALGILKQPLCLKRQRTDSLTASIEKYLSAEITFQKQFLNDPAINSDTIVAVKNALAKKCLRLANAYYYASKAGTALHYYWAAWRYNASQFNEYTKATRCLLSSPLLRLLRKIKG